jgi:hypothetical protein
MSNRELWKAIPAWFNAAVRAVEKLGDTIDVTYLNTEPIRFGTEWRVP